jgi:hypothetical protein
VPVNTILADKCFYSNKCIQKNILEVYEGVDYSKGDRDNINIEEAVFNWHWCEFLRFYTLRGMLGVQ